MRKSDPGRFSRGAAALLLASVFIHFADRILGVRIEVFSGGLGYFSGLWIVDLFLVPFLAGILVSLIFGFGGKWLAHLPPLIVRGISYMEVTRMAALPDGGVLIPMGWWGFFVILSIEFCAVGGVIGEVLIKRTYGRSTPQKAGT